MLIFACTVLNDFVPKETVTQNIFPILSKVLWSRINNCYSILFSNQKECIIISRFINSHLGPMYIETPNITMYIETPYITIYIETPYITQNPELLHRCNPQDRRVPFSFFFWNKVLGFIYRHQFRSLSHLSSCTF